MHAQGPDGEAKFWLNPEIELAMSIGLPQHQLNLVLAMVKEREDEIRRAWNTHFGG